MRRSKTNLCSAPVLAYPSPNRPFILTTDASTGSADQVEPGGLGAVLSQEDEKGVERAIDYASRTLKPFEKNYSAFMLEMCAASWAMDHWYQYLWLTPFYLYCDHKPLEKLTARQTKTLNRLQEQMLRFKFQIRYKKGSENSAADALSRSPVEELKSVGLGDKDLRRLQEDDEFCTAIKKHLTTGNLPSDEKTRREVLRCVGKCLVDNGLLYRQFERSGRLPRRLLVLPADLRELVFRASHTSLFGGHAGSEKTTWKIQEKYWWPAMETDIRDKVNRCLTCARSKRPNQYKARHAPHKSLPVPDLPNEHIHIDLFGPLKTSEEGKKFIMVATDRFTKMVTLAGLPNKEAETVARAFFEQYICKFSCPKAAWTDQGKEFCAKLSEEFFKLMGIKHEKTCAYRPQTNTYAEVFNKEIVKYLRTILEDDQTLDWEKYLAPLALAYNTGVHKSTLHSPFYLTFLHEPRLPFFDAGRERTLYGDDYPTDCLSRLRTTYRLAAANQEEAHAASLKQQNKTARHVEYEVGQQVLVAFPTRELKGNPKFRKPYAQGFVIQERLGEYTYVIKNEQTGRQHTVHADLLREQPSEQEGAPAVEGGPGRQFRQGVNKCNNNQACKYEKGVRAEIRPDDQWKLSGEEQGEPGRPERELEESLRPEGEDASDSEMFLSADEEPPASKPPQDIAQNTGHAGSIGHPPGYSGRLTRSRGQAPELPLVPMRPPEYKRGRKAGKR